MGTRAMVALAAIGMAAASAHDAGADDHSTRAAAVAGHYLAEIQLGQAVMVQPADEDEAEACLLTTKLGVAWCAKRFELKADVIRYVRAHAKYFAIVGNAQIGLDLVISDAREHELAALAPKHPALEAMAARRALVEQRARWASNQFMQESDLAKQRDGHPFQGGVPRSPGVTEATVVRALEAYRAALERWHAWETDKTVQGQIEVEQAGSANH